MKVSEIFTSIQGESTYAGLPCTFVRLTGCNLRCRYCDTAYAYEEGRDMTVAEVFEAVRGSGPGLVEITGGEPLLQYREVLDLTRRLQDAGFRVLIETNGTIDIESFDRRAVIIMDIKTPSSGMSDKNNFSSLDHIGKNDEIKFVICDQSDYEWAKGILKQYELTKRCTVLFSPAFGSVAPRALSSWIIRDRLDVRLNMQLHKYIYGPDERGV